MDASITTVITASAVVVSRTAEPSIFEEIVVVVALLATK